MKALILQEPGRLDSLSVITDREKPVPEADEIVVKVMYAGLNPSDHQVASYEGLSSERPRVLGLEVSGIVEAAGAEANGFKAGDRVYYLRSIDNLDGGFAEYARTKAHTVSKLPAYMPFEVAAVVPAAGFTAYQAVIQKLRPLPGRTILIHGGAGGVGGYTIQLARHRGLTVITTCLSADFDYVTGLGADHAVDFTSPDPYGQIAALTGGAGIDYILNTVSSESATRDMELLAFGGEMAVTAGFPDFRRLRFYDRGMSLHEIALGAVYTGGTFEAQANLAKIGNEVARLLAEGTLMPPQITVIAMEEIPVYLKKLKEGKITGKVAARIGG